MTDTLLDQTGEAKRTALGTLLIERGYIDQGQLDEALRRSAENGERLGEVIVNLGWASEDDLAKVLAEQWHLRYFERSAISFDGKALRRMSWEDASRLEALPIQENDEGAVVVAVAEPTDARLLALRELLGDRIDFVVVAKGALETGLRSELLARNGTPTIGTPAVEETELTDEAEPEVTDVENVETTDDGSDQFDAYEATATISPFAPVAVEPPAVVELTPATPILDADGNEPGADNFDEVARSLSDGLSSQLASLRSIVVEAETRREADRIERERLQAELERLQAELAQRDSTIAERDETVSSMQHQLREFADWLELRPSF